LVVFVFGWLPKCPSQSRKSSTAMNKTLNRPKGKANKHQGFDHGFHSTAIPPPMQ
jgi:hypothetical protein